MRLITLGELRLANGEADILPGRRKDLVLLAYLLQRAPRPVPRAELASLLWSDRPEARARHSLRQALRDLRHALGDAIDISEHQVRAAGGAVSLDVAQLEADVANQRFAAAAEAWRGDFLSGLDGLGGEQFRAWLEAERQRLRRLVGGALERLTAEAETRGEWSSAASWAQRRCEVVPASEAARTRLVSLLRLADRPEAAAAQHARFVAWTRSELGEEPSAEFMLLGDSGGPPRMASRPAGTGFHSAALFSADMMGRADAFGRLVERWHEVASGSGAVVVVGGEEGIGKSRLCDEFLQWLDGSAGEVLVLRARAYHAERRVPWAAARDLLSALADAPGLGGAPDAALAELCSVVPAIRSRFPRLPEASGGEEHLSPAVARVLGDVAAELPVVLFLDDFAAADEPTRRLLLSLARRLPEHVLLLVTAGGDGRCFDTVLDPLREIEGVCWLSLARLGLADVEAMLGSMLALEPQERHRLARRLHAEAEGNPFYVIALTSALADAGHLAPDASGVWHIRLGPDGSFPLPPDVHETVRARLDLLDEDARQLIGAAAVLGRSFDTALLEELAGLSPGAFCEAVDELVKRRLLRPAPVPARGYEFTHDLVRRVTCELLSPARRGYLEAAAGAARSHPPQPAVTDSPGMPTAARLLAFGSRALGQRAAAAVALLLAVGLLVSAVLARNASAPTEAVVLAVGQIRDFAGQDASVAAALPELLATNLSRAAAVQVISTGRMLELIAGEKDGPGAPAAAARRAGATLLVDGVLYRSVEGFRLDLRGVDLRDGTVRSAYSVMGAEPFALVDAATSRLLRELVGAAGELHVSDVTTRSLVAAGFYTEGLGAYYQGDLSGAFRLFDAALREDSTFAMAAFYAAETKRSEFASWRRYLHRARELSAHAAEPQRLLIHQRWADFANDPARLAIAETLAIRYPAEPDGHYLLGHALVWSGEFLGSLPHFRRAIEMDSVAYRADQPRCRTCEAYEAMVGAYFLADSLAAAERTAREWLRREPGSARAVLLLGTALERRGCPDEALRLLQQALSRQPSSASESVGLRSATCLLYRADFSGADRLLRAQLEAGDHTQRKHALWYRVILLRNQGRMEDALVAATEYRALTSPSAEPSDWLPYEAVAGALVLYEMGQHRRAAATFDSLSWFPRQEFVPGRLVRRRAWNLTHSAAALHAAGDTASLAALADSIEAYGARSAYGRDGRLHHHVRGLLWSARGRWTEAEASFRQAVFSPTEGYTRTNLELARVLMRRGRHQQAVEVLQPALRGGPQASNLYVTRTELHEALAQAHDAAGRADSAAFHYRRVTESWERADPQFHERRENARLALAALER